MDEVRTRTGMMKLDGKDLASLVDDIVAALRIKSPTWIALYSDSLPARVTEILLEGAKVARSYSKPDDDGLYATGGIRIQHSAVGEFTEVYVLIGTVYDEGSLTEPEGDD